MYEELKKLLEDQKSYINNPYPEHIAEKELEAVKRSVKFVLSKMISDEKTEEFDKLTGAEVQELCKIFLQDTSD